MAPKQEQESALLNPLVDGQDTDEDSESYHYVPPRRRRCSACRCVGWIFTLLSIIFISALSGAWISMAYLNIDQTCAAHTTSWCKSSTQWPQLKSSIDLSIAAPVLKDVSIKYHEQPFDGNFMEENDFRKNGSAKVDEAWESLGVDCMCLPLKQHCWFFG